MDQALTPREHPARIAFGPFELDASGGRLHKSGVRVRLAGQPFQILLVLLARPDEVVSRETLRAQIWGDRTFVDFEHNLSAAMNKLRRGLGDSADNPRYIETVPGRGYRFIGSVQQQGLQQTPANASVEIVAVPSRRAPKKVWLATGAAIGSLAVCLGRDLAGIAPPGSP